jgi:hypothetical protein
MKYNSYIIHLDVNDTDVVQPVEVAEIFKKYLQSVYNISSPECYYSGLLSSEYLQLPSISELDILKAIKRLRPSKSVGLDIISGFIFKGCFTRFGPLLEYVFDLSHTPHSNHCTHHRLKFLCTTPQQF